MPNSRKAMNAEEPQNAVERAPAIRKPRMNSEPYSASTKVSVVSIMYASLASLVIVPRVIIYHPDRNGLRISATPCRVSS